MGVLVNKMFQLAPKDTELPQHDRRCLSVPRRIWYSTVNVISNYTGFYGWFSQNPMAETAMK